MVYFAKKRRRSTMVEQNFKRGEEESRTQDLPCDCYPNHCTDGKHSRCWCGPDVITMVDGAEIHIHKGRAMTMNKGQRLSMSSQLAELACHKQWTMVTDKKPETLIKVLVVFINEFGRKWISIAMYVPENKVPADGFMPDQWFEDMVDTLCEYAPEGWYEWTYGHDEYLPINNVVAWMPLPSIKGVNNG